VRVLLVVEDDPDIRLLVRMLFAVHPDFTLDGEAADIAGAVAAAAASSPPDLIVLDHLLEGEVNGLEGAPRLSLDPPIRSRGTALIEGCGLDAGRGGGLAVMA